MLKAQRLRRWFSGEEQPHWKDEDLNSNPQHPHTKPGMVMLACNLRLGVRDMQILRTSWHESRNAGFTETLCLKATRWRATEKDACHPALASPRGHTAFSFTLTGMYHMLICDIPRKRKKWLSENKNCQCVYDYSENEWPLRSQNEGPTLLKLTLVSKMSSKQIVTFYFPNSGDISFDAKTGFPYAMKFKMERIVHRIQGPHMIWYVLEGNLAYTEEAKPGLTEPQVKQCLTVTRS